jgi:hypothetical protein
MGAETLSSDDGLLIVLNARIVFGGGKHGELLEL